MEKPPVNDEYDDESWEEDDEFESLRIKSSPIGEEASKRREVDKLKNKETSDSHNILAMSEEVDGLLNPSFPLPKEYISERLERISTNYLQKLYAVAHTLGASTLEAYISNGLSSVNLEDLKKWEGFSDLYDDEDEEIDEMVLKAMGLSERVGSRKDLSEEEQDIFEQTKKVVVKEEIAGILADRFFDKTWNTEKSVNWPLSFETMFEISREHKRKIAEKEKEIQTAIEKELMPRLLDKLRKSNLPIDIEEARQRLETLSFHVVDDYFAELEEIGGAYFAESNLIRIKPVTDKKYLEDIFVHEVMHALSGQTDVEDISPEFASSYIEDPHMSSFDVTKVGVGFGSEVFNMRKILRWLNEAVTEQVSMDLYDRTEGAYIFERELLQQLVELGLPYEDLLKAYFENYKESDGHKTPLAKNFFVKTNEVFGRGFLMKVDKFIRGGESESSRIDSVRVAAVAAHLSANGKGGINDFDTFAKEYEEKGGKEQ